MKKIAIAGAGGFSKEVYLLMEEKNKVAPQWDFIGFFDDNVKKGRFFLDFEVLGTIGDLNDFQDEINVVVAAGRSANVYAIKSKLASDKLTFPNVIHPATYLNEESLKIGIGNIIQTGCTFSADNTLGSFNVFNASVNVGHDTIVGNYNTFGTRCLISGGVTIGNMNNFGINSGILQYKKVGNNNTISPLSMLYRSIKNDGHYIGNPAFPTGI